MGKNYDEDAMNRVKMKPPNGVTSLQRTLYSPFNDQTSSGSSAFDTDSSTSTTSTYDAAIDHTSGQDRAASLSDALLDARGDDFMTLMTDPIAAVATGDLLRNLSRMIAAYKGGYDLPDLEVIPHTRMANEKFGTSTTKKSSSGHSGSKGLGLRTAMKQSMSETLE